jgi:hypothetical protein
MAAFLPALGLVLVALASAPTAFHAMFSGFEEYDDEGYLLIVLREYARGGRLYDEVYSQYGPAYHQLAAGAFRLAGLPFTRMSGRALAVGLWLAGAAVLAALALRLTGSLLLAACAQLVAFQALAPSRDEPLHPGAWIVLLVAAAVLAGSDAAAPGWRGRPAGPVAGALLGGALLTKINMGGLAIVAAAFAGVAPAPSGGRRAASRLAAAGFALAPVALLGPAAAHPEVRAYLAVAAAASIGVALVRADRRHAEGAEEARGALGPLAGGVAGAVVRSCAWEWWRGTAWRGLAEGIVLGPARHPGAFLEPPPLEG